MFDINMYNLSDLPNKATYCKWRIGMVFKDSHVIRLLKIVYSCVKNSVYFHSIYGIMLISPDNHNYIQFCEA